MRVRKIKYKIEPKESVYVKGYSFLLVTKNFEKKI